MDKVLNEKVEGDRYLFLSLLESKEGGGKVKINNIDD